MFKTLFVTTLLAGAAASASAHEIWIERDGSAARVHVGDAAGERDKGEDIAKLVVTSRLYETQPDRAFPVTAQPDHLAADVGGAADLRYYNDQVWEPWQTDEGDYQAAAFQAKAGRESTQAVHAFELVPVAAGSDSFILTFEGQPLADTGITVINPDLWEKSFKTDGAGRFTVPVAAKGRYILVARHTAPADVEIAGRRVASLQHIASLSFVAH
ncbi:MAG: nickel uptake transporter family protein [Sphingomonadales bacterium 32-64-17]|nr:MAG: nickel uptake transporter family protein [Sphingomonadales bacterium 32-64-17]